MGGILFMYIDIIAWCSGSQVLVVVVVAEAICRCKFACFASLSVV